MSEIHFSGAHSFWADRDTGNMRESIAWHDNGDYTNLLGQISDVSYEPGEMTTRSISQPEYSRRAFSFSVRIEHALANAAFLPCLEIDTEVFPCFP